MSMTNRAFEFSAKGAQNTKVIYQMVQGDKVLKEGEVIFPGKISNEDVEQLQEQLSSENSFDPYQVGVPNLSEKMPLSWTPTGNETHRVKAIEITDARPNKDLPPADHIISAFEPYSPDQMMV